MISGLVTQSLKERLYDEPEIFEGETDIYEGEIVFGKPKERLRRKLGSLRVDVSHFLASCRKVTSPREARK